jgi:hypothetical protein
MKRRILGLGLVVVCAGATLAGCETLHPLGLRTRDDPSAARIVAPSEPQGFEAETPESDQELFRRKPSRLRGALSSEGAEVEQHLGIR